ncbi:MAG TPA: SH3 domain-containing protein [Pirellulales bacterium]
MYHRQTAATYFIRVALACALSTCLRADVAAAEPSPYQARVIAAGAPVHSGPGDNFYPTDTLSQGDTVEVYREKAGGWLAIRPPSGSFSWIAERDLIIKDGGLAEVVRDEVPSRIGSRINDRHNAAQVRLKKGEGVEVLGEETVNGEKWCKVSPPAGEFRWIQAAVVERTGPIQTSASSSSSPSEQPATETNPIQLTSANADASTPNTNSTSDASPPPLLPVAKTSAPIALSTTAAPAAPTTPSPAAPAAPAAAAQPPASQASGDLSHELAAIELRLSRMVAAPTNLWNTDRLERDTAQLMARAKTPAERDAVRVTQEKISRFAAIGRRANPSSANVAQAGQPPTTPLPATAATAVGGRYDAVGILRPVVSRRAGAPQFALVDERGQVVSFVTATPDLNLQPYLGHRVGVVGNRGYIPEFQRSNVTAARVTPLNDRIVR